MKKSEKEETTRRNVNKFPICFDFVHIAIVVFFNLIVNVSNE